MRVVFKFYDVSGLYARHDYTVGTAQALRTVITDCTSASPLLAAQISKSKHNTDLTLMLTS
jgi:hypothetical protein